MALESLAAEGRVSQFSLRHRRERFSRFSSRSSSNSSSVFSPLFSSACKLLLVLLYNFFSCLQVISPLDHRTVYPHLLNHTIRSCTANSNQLPLSLSHLVVTSTRPFVVAFSLFLSYSLAPLIHTHFVLKEVIFFSYLHSLCPNKIYLRHH